MEPKLKAMMGKGYRCRQVYNRGWVVEGLPYDGDETFVLTSAFVSFEEMQTWLESVYETYVETIG